MRQSRATKYPRAVCWWKIIGGRKRVWGIRWLSAAVPKTMGFHPYGNKSSGLAARTPGSAATTVAAGEMMERADLGVRQLDLFIWSGNMTGRGRQFWSS